jgi:hypothetical protein
LNCACTAAAAAAATGTWEVTYSGCTVSSPQPVFMNLTVTVMTPGGCITLAPARLRVDADCCVKGDTDFALGDGALSKATCFLNMPTICKDETTTTPAKPKRMLLQSGATRWGWSNRLTGPGSAEYRLWAGAGQCLTHNGADVGAISVGCANAGSGALVSLSLLQTLGAGISSHYYLGCANISKCNPPNFASTGSPTIKISGVDVATNSGPFSCSPGSTTGSCGGSINFNNIKLAGSDAKVFRMGCQCDSVRWVFHQGGGTHYPEPLADGSCPRDP